jgi:hypothetical protein
MINLLGFVVVGAVCFVVGVLVGRNNAKRVEAIVSKYEPMLNDLLEKIKALEEKIK